MTWVESTSASFRARHDDADTDDAARVLDQLEQAREGLEHHFARTVGEIAVVIHDSELGLGLSHPYLLFARALTAPAGRRYLAGWFSATELHVLAPRLLARRASSVRDSRELLMLAPSALYAQLVVVANNRDLPPPFTPASFNRYVRWAWPSQGAGQYFSGQTVHVRPAIARRLHEGAAPSFPPGIRDAVLLGGTVLDLLAREEGVAAAVRLTSRLHPEGPEAALIEAFRGRSLSHTEGTWRTHLARLASV